ncbi:PAS domain S-box-containing protein/diguanylate cyclase (GGDEF) domain-containing protein [Rhizobium sp. RU20A]|uniref:bifunctional diguanylate cyclase/phosphodiesterase n=1 Tax=Rhizobium sp. RU20A TaxID=1907412 RepID=UPI000956BF88|nr:EAL domain-containing protein [Rhizobium sp. RU20A]SIR06729.1 PAS domain S-box-containing protein/diguanylate cyclase (GGDEF) domain-containing protein [Rhizobium sp. RU20A]
MIKVLNCLVVDHDPKLVLLAAALCFLTSFGAIVLLQRATAAEGRGRLVWQLVAAGAAGYGIWSTHFVAMLAYDTGVVMGFEVGLTLLSLLIAVLMTFAGLVLASAQGAGKGWTLAGAACIALGVSGMHFVGMNALQLPGSIEWDPPLVAASLVFALSFSAAALFATRTTHRSAVRRTLLPAVLLTLAIVSLHFTAMGAVTVGDGPVSEHLTSLVSPGLLALMITAIAVSMLCAGIVIAGFAKRTQRDRAENERQLSVLVRGVTDYAIYMLDVDGRVTSWNAGAERLKGYSAAEIIGRSFACFYSTQEQADGEPERTLAEALSKGGCEREGYRYHKDGTTFWANVVIEPIHNEDGCHIGFAKITRDQTRQKAEAEKLARMTANLDSAVENITQGICLFDADDRLVLCNERVRRLFGATPDMPLVGMGFRELLCAIGAQRGSDPALIAAFAEKIYHEHMAPLKATGASDVLIKLPSGLSVSVKYRAIPGGGWVSTYEDITERLQSEARIAFLARHDGLTGLPNREQFRNALNEAITAAERSGERVAVVALDVDGFKEMNDIHGAAGGDLVLKTLAERLVALPEAGQSVARLGGDEFAVVLRFEELAQLEDLLADIKAATTTHLMSGEDEINIGCSLGVAIFPQDAATAETLVNNADLALQRAKGALTDNVCFYETEMDEAARLRRVLAVDLWQGVARRQFALHYQVQTSVATGETTGYEVLLRWAHPERGFVSPASFIPIAEECGAILPIGEWVLKEACREAAGWDNGLKIAVNLSPVQLAHADIVALVSATLAETGLDPRRLELEITETTIIGDKQRALETLRQIKALGVTIALDDFGTGYSSLDTLRSFPFDKIKLDRSFMNAVEDSAEAKAILRAILALGSSLRVPVLAEGVETVSQLDILRLEGCDEAQGYLLGRPQPIDQIHAAALAEGPVAA